MEDRVTPFLYLELTGRPTDEYAAARVPQVLDRPGVDRAWWWSDCAPGRRDLPRRLHDVTTLGLYECTADFLPPTADDGVLGIHLQQRRPGQGTLAGGPTLGLELVLISPKVPEHAQVLRDWADFVHIHDIAAAAPEHFTMITPYENVTGGEPRFLHLYELDTADPEPAFQAMTPATKARLDDVATLGLYECTHGFEPPSPTDGVLGIHLRQVRPGQGTLGTGPTLGLEVVLISPRHADRAQALRDWADFVHIHDIAAAAPEHFTMITPYENVTGGEPRYLHLYELDTDDPEPAFQAMTPATKARFDAGGWSSHPFDEWAWHPELVIDFVSTFRLAGSAP